MYKYCDVFHWRYGIAEKILIVNKGRVEIPKHGMSVGIISFEPPMLALYNVNLSNSGMYRCYCESALGVEYTADIGVEVRPVPTSQDSDVCDFSSCSTCITSIIIPMGCVIIMILVVVTMLMLYFNRFRLIYDCSKLW